MEEGQQNLESTMAQMLNRKKDKLEAERLYQAKDIKMRQIEVDERNAETQAKVAEANLKQQNNFQLVATISQ